MLRRIDGFDNYTVITQKWSTGSTGTPGSTGNGRTGASWRGGNSNVLDDSALAGGLSEYIIGFAIRQSGFTSAFAGGTALNVYSRVEFMEGNTVHTGIYLGTPPGSPIWRACRANDSAQQLAAGSTTIAANTWYYCEFRVKVHDTAGEVQMRINGATEFAATGIDTRNGATGIIDRIRVTNDNNSTSDVDDLYIVDRTGTRNADFVGDCKVETLRPSAAGTSTQFTPSADSNWQNVDDTTPDGDTTYNASSTVGHVDSFACTNLATATIGTVRGVQLFSVMRKDDAGSVSTRARLLSNGNIVNGATRALSDNYLGYREDVVEANPDGGVDWTRSTIDALEIGYEVV